MHERLERHLKDHIRHPADFDITSLIGTHGFGRILDVLAIEAIRLRNEADAEGDESGRSAYGNLAYKLIGASQEHDL
jgi:hypothetical protein